MDSRRFSPVGPRCPKKMWGRKAEGEWRSGKNRAIRRDRGEERIELERLHKAQRDWTTKGGREGREGGREREVEREVEDK